MLTVKITKMQGCGNDFIFMDYEEYERIRDFITSNKIQIAGAAHNDLSKETILKYLSLKMCDRHFAIGADGLIIPFPSNDADADISWEYYNSDGTSAQMCGNGMRCFTKYVHDKGIITKKSFSVKTRAGIIKPEILENRNIKVNMGNPILREENIPFNSAYTAEGEKDTKTGHLIAAQDKIFEITPVSMGNPHCVIFTEENTLEMAKKYGPDIEKHPSFPEKTNVEFVKIISEKEIELSVYERGCGITLACGTGACAGVVACILNNLTENNVRVNLPGGALNVEWSGNALNQNKNVFLTGSAEYSFTAEYVL